MTKTINPMLEKGMTAMGAALDWDGAPFASNLSDSELETLFRAAVQALMEPDEAMVEAGAKVADKPYGQFVAEVDARDVFQAMLAEALKGEK